MKRRPTTPKPGLRPRASKPGNSLELSPARKWLFRFGAAVVLPALGLILIELILRLAGSGYSPDFFTRRRIGGADCVVENDQFGFRFFPRDIARTPATIRFPAQKAPGTYRIFILGESAAMGDPEPAFGAGRYLEALLQERFPQAKFEVINAAMTAINSHAIVPIAQDCARYQGDLWVVYAGNNEMIGPFGVATAAGVQTPPPVGLVRLTMALKATRLGQLGFALAERLGSGGAASWGGMQMFGRNLVAPDDWRRARVYRNFEQNLRDIVRTGLDSGASVVLSTLAVNLKDCPPFGSLISSNLTAGDRAEVERLLAAGMARAGESNFVQAVQLFERAISLNPRNAELEYRLGAAQFLLKNPSARGHFQQACDLDCLTFRATTQINAATIRVAQQLGRSQLTLFDAAAEFENDPPDRIPGAEDFYEHVHFTFDGNYRLARGWAKAILPRLPQSITPGGAPDWAAQEVCERRLGLTDWTRGNVLAEVRNRYQHPPLNSQPNNPERLQSLAARDAARRRRLALPETARAAKATYAESLSRHPEDFYLHEGFGNFLWDRGEIDSAIEQWRQVRELIPQDYAPYYELGRLAAVQGRFDDAQSLLRQAIAMRPSFALGWFELGKIAAAQGDFQSAIRDYDRALRHLPQDADCWFHRGVASAMQGQRAAAVGDYRRAVQFDPEHWKAHFELGSLLGQQGDLAESCKESQAAVRLNPDYPIAHLNLGIALFQLSQLPEAKLQFQEVLRLDPTNTKASDYLSKTLLRMSQSP